MKSLILFAVFVCFYHFSFALAIKSISGENLFTTENIVLNTEAKKGTVLVFMSAKCPCSNSHVNEIKKLSTDFSDFQFAVVHANADEAKDTTVAYFKKANFPFPVIKDQKFQLADQFQAFKTPHAFIVLPDGSFAYQGGVSNSHDFAKAKQNFLREALTDLKEGKAVRTPEGRTLGCVISRGEKNVW